MPLHLPIHICRPAKRQLGVGLLEVLVTILLLSVGILSMSKIHGLLIRDGGTANNRSLAISLAQEKIDDLRAFKWVDPTASAGEKCGAGIYCYSEIADDAGGNEKSDGSLWFPASTFTLGNASFTRSWKVTQNATYQKTISVTVGWTDQNGSDAVTLQTAIFADDPTVTAFGSKGPGGGGGPEVKYSPKLAPDVVSIQVAGGSRETSKPLPDVSSKALSVATQFTTVNYKDCAKDSGKCQQTQEDFKTVSCTCQFASKALANPAAYYTYDGETKSLLVNYPNDPKGLLDTSGNPIYKSVEKWTGTPITSQGDSQDPLCSSCCADHHDSEGPGTTSSTTALFDPDRPSGDYTSDDHNHYYYSNANNPAQGLALAQPIAGNPYLESCRFLRVDGIYRIMQDWRLSKVTVMPQSKYLEESSDNLGAYRNYVQAVALAQAAADKSGGTLTLPNLDINRNPDVQDPGYLQLMARGIYLDRVYESTKPNVLDGSYYSALSASNPLLPVNEVNVTLLASWASGNPAVVSVSNDTIKDITAASTDYYGVYSRGLATIQAGSGGTATVSAYMLPSNSGLTAGMTRSTYANAVDYLNNQLPTSGTVPYSSEMGMDPSDHNTNNRLSSIVTITRSGTTSNTISGQIIAGNFSADLSKLTVSGNGVTCSVATATSNATTFTCTGSTNGPLTILTAQNGGFFANYATSTTCTPSQGFCTNPISVYGPTMLVSGTCTGTTSTVTRGNSTTIVNTCNNNTLSIKASNTPNSLKCTTGTNPQCEVPVSIPSGSWTGTLTITDTANGAKVSGGSGSSGSCGGSAQSTVTINLVNLGPGDQPSSFWMCDQ